MEARSSIDPGPIPEAPVLPLLDNGVAQRGARGEGPRDAGALATIRRLKLWRAPLVMGTLFVGAVVGLYFQPPGVRLFFGLTGLEPGGGASRPIAVSPPAPAPAMEAVRFVAALGRLRPAGDAVTVAPPFGSADARVARILVAEGDAVSVGQAIVELDSLPQLEAQRESARAAVAAHRAALAQTEASVAASLDEARATRDRSASASALAASELARVEGLAARGVASSAQLEQAQSAADQAAHERDRAEAALARFSGAERGAQADVVLAARNLDVARAELARADQDLARGVIVAPISGVVLKLHVRPGEKPGLAGVATLGDIDRMEAELEVYQTDVRRIALGQRVTLIAEALDAPLAGSVSRIGLEVERQTIVADDPAAHTDARIVRVEVALDAESTRRARGFTGLEVLGRIDVGDGA